MPASAGSCFCTSPFNTLHLLRHPQNKLFGGLVGATPCTVQLELRPSAAAAASGGVQPTVTVKNKRDEVETMPLFANKDTISGEVGACCDGMLLGRAAGDFIRSANVAAGAQHSSPMDTHTPRAAAAACCRRKPSWRPSLSGAH